MVRLLRVYRNVVRAPFDLAGEIIRALVLAVTVLYVRLRIVAGVVKVWSN